MLSRERLRQAFAGKKPTWRVSSGWPCSSPPIIRQWNTSEYSGVNEKPSRMPSRTAISDTGSTSMPVSSYTSLIAISDGEYPTSAHPTGYSQMPLSARWVRRISPASLPTTAATATFGVM